MAFAQSSPCYRPGAATAAAAAATDDYGDSPCGKSGAAPLVVGRPNTAPGRADVGDRTVLPTSSPGGGGGVVVRLIDRKYSLSGRGRELTSNLLYSPNYGCQL